MSSQCDEDTWVIAVVLACAGVFALGWFGATGDGWEHDGFSAVAGQLIKT